MSTSAVPTDKGSNAGAKVNALVAGMVAGADSIDDMALLRHGAMDTLFDRPYAPSTLGSFLREFTFGHVRQLDAVASRFLAGLHGRTPLLAGIDGPVMVDLDDTIIEVHGYAKQGIGYGYSGIRGLNALIATVTTSDGRTGDHWPAAAQRGLRLPPRSRPDGRRHPGHRGTPALTGRRPPRRWCGPIQRSTAIRAWPPRSAAARRCRSPCARTRKSKPRSPPSTTNAWTPIEYTDAVYDESTGQWISRAEVAEIAFTAFSSRKASQQVPGRLVVRRIPDLNPTSGTGQATLFDIWRFHAFFTTTDLDTVTADKTHRGHAIIEAVHADLKNSALAHLPSGRFAANAAWLVLAVMAFNLTRAAATLTGSRLAQARTATIRRTLITVPARIACSARRLTLHLPRSWPWAAAWNTLFNKMFRRNQPLIV